MFPNIEKDSELFDSTTFLDNDEEEIEYSSSDIIKEDCWLEIRFKTKVYDGKMLEYEYLYFKISN